MKGRLGNPTFLIRLDQNEEKEIIKLSGELKKDSYPKTIIAVAMQYKSEKMELKKIIAEQNQIISKLKKDLSAERTFTRKITAMLPALSNLVNKVSDIKPQLRKICSLAGRSPK